MIKKTKKTGGKKTSSVKRIVINVFAVIGALAVIMMVVCGIGKSSHRGDSLEQKAQHKAEKMAKKFQLDNAQQAKVNSAWLKYFNSKKQAKDNLLVDFKSAMPADQYKKIEEKMNRKRGY